MNSRTDTSHDSFELRSDKVQNLLGEVPNKFIRWGTLIIFLIFIILIVIVLSMKYPYGNGESIFEHIIS